MVWCDKQIHSLSNNKTVNKVLGYLDVFLQF